MIVDAHVVLAGFLSDEAQAQAQAVIRNQLFGRRHLAVPSLLVYEVTNAAVQAACRGCISTDQAQEILATFEGLAIELQTVMWQSILSFAQRFDRSTYDAACLALADAAGQPLSTGGKRLYNAVRERLDWVRWLGDYEEAAGGDLREVVRISH